MTSTYGRIMISRGGGSGFLKKSFLIGAKNKMLSMLVKRKFVLRFEKYLQHMSVEIKRFLIQGVTFIHIF